MKSFASAEFMVGPDVHGPRTVRMYTASPTQFERDHLGQLFVFAEIDAEGSTNEDILNTLIEDVKRNYYSTEHESIAQNVEEALTKTNRSIAEVLEQHGPEFLEHLNMIILLQHGAELHLSSVGDVHAFLIHQKKILDVLESSGTSRYERVNPLKVFSNVVSGSVSKDDMVILCNTTILDYLSLEKIRKTFISQPVTEAIAGMKQLLSEANPETLFAMLAWEVLNTTIKKKELPPIPNQEAIPDRPEHHEPIALLEEEDAPDTGLEQSGSGKRYPPDDAMHPTDDSLTRLQNKERQTSELLEPGIRNTLLRVSSRVQQTVRGFRSSRDETPKHEDVQPLPARLRQRQTTHTQPRGLLARILRLVVVALASIVEIFLRGVKALLSLRPKSAGKHWQSGSHSRTASLIARVRDASVRTKIVLGAAVLFLFVFALLITRDAAPDASGTATLDYEALLATAQEKTQEANAVLIYGNEADARTLFSDSLGLLKQIPNDQGDTSDQAAALLKETQNSLNRINGVNVLENPAAVADIKTSFPNVATDQLMFFQGMLWASHPGDPILYQVNPISGNVTDRQTNAGHGIASITPSSAQLLLFGSTGEATLFDPNKNTTSKVSVTYKQSSPTITGGQLFNGRLYTVDQNTGLVYRHDPVPGGYAEGQEWITDGTVLRSPTSMSIDGSLYVSESDGSLVKLFTGKKTADPAFTIEPKIGQRAVLTSTELSKNLYIADPANNRVVIFQKDSGKILAQFTSSKFDALKDISVDESRNKIFVLNNTVIYEIDIPQTKP